MKNWEYDVINIREEGLKDVLNLLGRDGWELVAVKFYTKLLPTYKEGWVKLICKRKMEGIPILIAAQRAKEKIN